MGFCRAGLLAALVHIVWGTAAFSQDVTLTSRDGLMDISGTLVGFDGEFYRVDTVYGQLSVDGSGVLCSGPGCPDLDAYIAEIRFSGAVTIGETLLPALILAFAQDNEYSVVRQPRDDRLSVYVLTEIATGQTAARFSVRLSDSDEGFADLLADESDFAMLLRQISAQETALAIEAGLGAFSNPGQNRVIALDALVPVVSPRNSVTRISPQNLARIFAGDLSNWQELGGLDAPVALHLRNRSAGELRLFQDRVMGPSGLTLSADIVRHPSNRALVAAVAADPFAIGLSTLSEQHGIQPLVLAGRCGFRAEAAPAALKSGDYALTAPVFLYSGSRRPPAIGREFLRYITTPAAQTAVLRAGFVDQTISRTPVGRQGQRLANAISAAGDEIQLGELKRLVTAMTGAQRLSVTFRFEDGSSRLTAQSLANIALLARALETGSIGAGTLIFVGFSDGEGNAVANRKLSRKRAESVRAAVKQAATTADPGRVRLTVEGFGEAMPMACDDTEWGRQINRRVEVWVR